MTAARPCPGANCQWQNAEGKGQRGHNNRAKTQFGRLERRLGII